MNFLFAQHALDPRRHELRQRGKAVHLQPQVFDLLAFLIRNHDRIVSKDEILDTIWDGRIVSEAALASRIKAARKAIGDNGNDQVFIRTFHKRGFRFVGEVKEVLEGGVDTGAAPAGEPTRLEVSKTLDAAVAVPDFGRAREGSGDHTQTGDEEIRTHEKSQIQALDRRADEVIE